MERDERLGLLCDALFESPELCSAPAPELAERFGVDERDARECVAAARALWPSDPLETVRSGVRVERTGSELGRYRDVEVVGEGGMGVVYRAVDPALGRDVAVKLVKGASATSRELFLAEARITSQLEHPGIVPIHEVGHLPDGAEYFTMKLVRGESLQDVIDRLRDGAVAEAIGARAGLLGQFVKICDAMAFAHDRGVIHRDLKPGNVMVGSFGEVLLMDWGLAKAIGVAEQRSAGIADERDPALRTRDGAVLGTPAYMSPEQAAGDIARVDARSDVFGLGAMLYAILCLRAPFASIAEARAARPLAPSRRAPELAPPRELEAAVARAMAPDPTARYASVAALRADVQAFLDGRAVSTASYSAAQLIGLWVRRNRVLAVAAMLVAATVVTSASVSYVRIGAERDIAERRRREAVGQRKRAVAAEVATRRAKDRVTLELALQRHAREIADARAALYMAQVDPARELARLRPTLERLEALARASPGVGAWMLLGVGRHLVGQEAAAERALLRAFEVDPSDRWVNYHLTRIYLDRAVRASVRATPDGVPDRGPVERWLARAERHHARIDPAQLGAAERDLLALYRAFCRRDLEGAARLAARGIEVHGRSRGAEEYWCMLALVSEGDRAEGYRRALTICPHHALSLIGRGYLALHEGDAAAALADGERVARARPESVLGPQLRGHALARLGRHAEAIAAWTRVLSLDRDYAAALLYRAQARLVVRQHAAAVRDFEASLRIDARQAEAWFGLGRAWQAQQRPGAALKALDRAVELRPDHSETRAARGQVLLAGGRLEDAVADFRRIGERGSARWAWVGWLNVALIRHRQGKAVEARAALEQARARTTAGGPERARVDAAAERIGR